MEDEEGKNATKKEMLHPMTANNLQPNNLSLWEKTLMAVSTLTHLPWDRMCVQQWARQAGLWQVSTNSWASSVSNVILSIG